MKISSLEPIKIAAKTKRNKKELKENVAVKPKPKQIQQTIVNFPTKTRAFGSVLETNVSVKLGENSLKQKSKAVTKVKSVSVPAEKFLKREIELLTRADIVSYKVYEPVIM